MPRACPWVSTDQTITTEDHRVGTISIPALAPGESKAVVIVATVPAGSANIGVNHIGVIADYTSKQYETDEGNNSLAGNAININSNCLALPLMAGATEGSSEGD